jgi:hypothetical protein
VRTRYVIYYVENVYQRKKERKKERKIERKEGRKEGRQEGGKEEGRKKERKKESVYALRTSSTHNKDPAVTVSVHKLSHKIVETY